MRDAKRKGDLRTRSIEGLRLLRSCILVRDKPCT